MAGLLSEIVLISQKIRGFRLCLSWWMVRARIGCSVLNIPIWIRVVYFSIGLDLAALGSSLIWDCTCMYLINDACSSFQGRILWIFVVWCHLLNRQLVSALMGAYDPGTIGNFWNIESNTLFYQHILFLSGLYSLVLIYTYSWSQPSDRKDSLEYSSIS